ncbi:Glu-tRNA(Gln) amidotransferase subunit GatD [Candidatus Woesearchaeota archaeon]|nr:Glu-tRNA(Gln) amidotransferase subunit GatD [Candidatus Woesearchaeota archaeon]
MPNPGDKVKVILKDRAIEGALIPNEETDSLVIKLKSGYNVGIEKSKVQKIEVLMEHKAKEPVREKPKFKPGLPTISILHTGGTIASKVDYETGGVIARFEPEELLANYPELFKIANIKSRLVSKMFSEDMRFGHYKLMIKAIEDEIKAGADGIILTHGTDTLGYTSAALAFALENLPIPIILVGAQRSSDRGSNDAAMNLICAANFITKTDFAGVAICMHETSEDTSAAILPACKTRKLHTSRRDAFRAVNDTIIAKVDFKTHKVAFVAKGYEKKAAKPDAKKNFAARPNFEEKVAILKCHPNMFPEQFSFFKDYKGLVIEGTGLGQAPTGVPNELCKIHEENFKAIEEVIKSGTVVVMCSQCIFGKVHMHVYSNAINLANIGVIPGEDMLSETAFIKLAWLLGNYNDKDEIKSFMGKNLRGEINERLLLDDANLGRTLPSMKG